MVRKIRKRDGSVVAFDKEKITNAIWNAARSVGGTDRKQAEYLTNIVLVHLESIHGVHGIPKVEDVQDLVEKVLIEERHAKTAKAYILYRKGHQELREIRGMFDTIEAVEDYIGMKDWMIKENSNMGFSLQGLNNYLATKIVAKYWMRRIYPEAIRKTHEDVDVHIHDLGTLGAYCFDDKTKILTEDGWKLFKDVARGERVATKNLKTGMMEFQVPYDRQVYNYSGDLYSFEGRSVSLLVTPEHRLLVRRKHKRTWEFVNPTEFKYGMEFDKRVSWNGDSAEYFKIPSLKGGNRKKELEKFKINDYLEFMGWYISEGSAYEPSKGDYRISIAQSEKKYRKEIISLLERMEIKYNSSEFNIHIHSKDLFYHVKKLGISKFKYVPNHIKKLSPRLISVFLRSLFMGDGSFSNKGKFYKYYTNSKQLAEDVIECLLKIGLCGTITKRKGMNMYLVSVENNHLTPIYRNKIVKEKYTGKVYDFSVRNETLIVMREGKVVVSGNCVGWDLKDLLLKGFTGVPGKVSCSPPKHFKPALGQIVNFFYTLQGETAGAQAFSNFDTLLAPYIRYDNLEYKQIKQAMQEFVFNLAVPTRVGFQCMSGDTEILTPSGWKGYDEIKRGDKIKTFNIKNGVIEDQVVNNIFSRKYNGIMYNLKNRIQDQLISPKHRVVRRKFQTNKYVLEEIDSVVSMKSPFIVPIAGKNNKKDVNLSDNKIKLMAWIIAEGSVENYSTHRHSSRITIYQSAEVNPSNYKEIINLLDKFKLTYSTRDSTPALGKSVKMIRLNASSSRIVHKLFDTENIVHAIPSNVLNMSARQSNLFLGTYLKADGFENCKISTTDPGILDGLQQIVINAGYGFTVLTRKPTIGKKLIYVLRLIKHEDTYIQKVDKVNYNGVIWCPNTKNETVIARRNGKVFITGNTPFTNITLDLKVPQYMKNEPVVIAGKVMNETYGEFQKEMDLVNKAFAEVMLEGDANGRVFTFPIPTYNITKDFDWDNSNYDLIWEMTSKYGIPYFSNFINSDMNPEDSRSMCCRLRLNTKELRKRGGGLFGANPQTGSAGVVTINMPRIGFTSRDEAEFLDKLGKLMELSKESLEIKRKVLEQFTKIGLYPYSKFYLQNVYDRFGDYWKNHFSTIGLLGMNEAIMNFMPGETIATEKGKKFAEKVLDFMRAKLEEYQEETGNIYNLEATPGEGATYRFAKADKQRFGRIIVANEEDYKNGAEPYYTNSTQLPVNYTEDVFEALELQDDLQTKYTGGCIEKGNNVLTNKGLLLIEDIVNNFSNLKPLKVLSYNVKNKTTEWDLVNDAVKIDVKKHDKIRVRAEKNLDITTSDWHPFFVLERVKPTHSCPVCNKKVNGVKSFAVHIKNNKECMKKYKDLQKYNVIEKRADELRKGDYILQNSNNLYSDKKSKLDGDLMWLIGFFIGDGCISEFIDNRGGNSLRRYKVRFNTEHKSALQKIKKILMSHFDSNVSIIKNDKRSIPLMEISVSKKNVVDFLIEYGFTPGKKVYDIRIPQKVKDNLTKSNVFSLLSGLADSDGHIGKRYSDFEYYTVSEQLVHDMIEVFSIAGIMISYSKKITKRNNEKDIYRVRIPAYQMSTLKYYMKNTVNFDRIRDNVSMRKKRHLPVVRVKNISKVDVKDNKFYDLSVKKNKNYLAGKNTLVFIHNTVLHMFTGERLDKNGVKILIQRITNNFRLPYITLTPTFSICPKHGYLQGDHEYCPKCDSEIGYEKNKAEKIAMENKITEIEPVKVYVDELKMEV